MNASEFERYLALLSGLLRLSRRQRDSIAQELRDHLEERLADLRAAGVSEEDAVREALEEFGDVASLAHEFAGAAGNQHRRTIMRITVGALGAVSAAALAVVTCWPTPPVIREVQAQAPVLAAAVDAEPPNELTTDEGDAANAAALKKLEAAVDFQVEDTPLTDAVQMLAKLSGVTARINTRSLHDEGIDPGMPVTIRLQKTPARTVLRLVLEGSGLRFVVHDGMVDVLTAVAAEERLSTRVYPAADLLPTGKQMANRNIFELGAGGLLGPAAASAELIDMITSIIGPQSWDEVGGRGSIQEFQGMLIVSQTEQNHRELAALLANVRRVLQQPPGREGAPTDQVATALGKRVELKVDGKPLSEAIEILREQLGIEVVLDLKSLADEGIDAEIQVELPQAELPARRALSLMLRPLGLAFINVDGAVLQVTSIPRAEETLTTALFNVRDLLFLPGRDPLDGAEPDYDSIIRVITSTVEPQSWDDVGGRGSVQGFRDLLVVSQTADNQLAVAELLARLRTVRQKQKVPTAPGVDPAAPPAVPIANPEGLELRAYGLGRLQLALGDSGGQASDEELTKTLLQMVQESVDPKSWQSAGGKGQAYSMRNAMGVPILVVRQTPAIHRQVQRLLRTLEQEVQQAQQQLSGGGFM